MQATMHRLSLSGLGRRPPAPRKTARPALFIVEARAGGRLVTDKDKQPPYPQATQQQLVSYYLEHEHRSAASWEEVCRWFESRGWFIRQRSW